MRFIEGKEVVMTTVVTVNQKAWPATLPEQIKAVADILMTILAPLELDAVAAHFKARGRWHDRLPTIRNTLVAGGRVKQHSGTRWMTQWARVR